MEITEEWLREHDACVKSFDYYLENFDDPTDVKEVLHKLTVDIKTDWIGWLLAQEVELTQFLLDCGADVHARNDYALRWASKYGHTEVVKLLLDCGADVHVDNDCALRLASEYGHTEIVKLLLDYGADVHADNDCALKWATRNNHTDVLRLLETAYSHTKISRKTR